MQVQLEIVTRRNGRFVKVQDVLVDGQQIGTLHRKKYTLVEAGTLRRVKASQWIVTYTDAFSHVEPLVFKSRDDACVYLYDHYTFDASIGEFSLKAWRTAGLTYDQAIDRQYAETDEALMRADSPAYDEWLDRLDIPEVA